MRLSWPGVRINRNGGAFGVRRLGAALVVVSKFHGFPRQETQWAHYRMIAAVLKWTTKAAPSRRTPKAVAISILRNNGRLAPNLTSLAFRRKRHRRGEPALQPHLPRPARSLHFIQPSRRDQNLALERAASRRGDNRRDGRRTGAGVGRSGRGRNGHSRGQAVALHALRWHSSGDDAADLSGRRHGQRGILERPALYRLETRARARAGVRRFYRRVHHRGDRDVSESALSPQG